MFLSDDSWLSDSDVDMSMESKVSSESPICLSVGMRAPVRVEKVCSSLMCSRVISRERGTLDSTFLSRPILVSPYLPLDSLAAVTISSSVGLRPSSDSRRDRIALILRCRSMASWGTEKAWSMLSSPLLIWVVTHCPR